MFIVQLNPFINGKLFETFQEYSFSYFLAVTTSHYTFLELIFPSHRNYSESEDDIIKDHDVISKYLKVSKRGKSIHYSNALDPYYSNMHFV